MRLDFIPRMSVSTPGHGMIHCPECGWEIDPDDEMCPNFGVYLADYEDLEPSGESGAQRYRPRRALRRNCPKPPVRLWTSTPTTAPDAASSSIVYERPRDSYVE